MKCVVCDLRPAKFGGLCANCYSRIEAEKRKHKPDQPLKFATYRGHVVGFYKNGGGKLIPRLINRKPGNLPKNLTLDLNTYIEGFTRDQVKKIKSTILTLANA